MSITQINGLGKQVVRASAVLPSQLKSSDSGGVAQKGKIDQIIHGLKILPGFFGARFEMEA